MNIIVGCTDCTPPACPNCTVTFIGPAPADATRIDAVTDRTTDSSNPYFSRKHHALCLLRRFSALRSNHDHGTKNRGNTMTINKITSKQLISNMCSNKLSRLWRTLATSSPVLFTTSVWNLLTLMETPSSLCWLKTLTRQKFARDLVCVLRQKLLGMLRCSCTVRQTRRIAHFACLLLIDLNRLSRARRLGFVFFSISVCLAKINSIL